MYEEMKDVSVESMVGISDRKPYVVVDVGSEAVQMDPAQARRVGSWMVECAEAAEQDAFMLRFLNEQVEIPIEQAVACLGQWREARVAARFARAAGVEANDGE